MDPSVVVVIRSSAPLLEWQHGNPSREEHTHETHVDGQSRLVTDSGGNAAEQCTHFRTCLSEAEDVVDEEEH